VSRELGGRPGPVELNKTSLYHHLSTLSSNVRVDLLEFCFVFGPLVW
jgi:hypothetical protein